MHQAQAPPYQSYEEPRGHGSQQVQDEKFTKQSGFRDLLFAVLFFLHLVTLGAMWVIGFIKGDMETDPVEFLPDPGKELTAVLIVTLICLVSGALVSFLYLVFVKKFARQLIILTLIASVIMWLAFSVFLAVIGQIIPALFTAAVALLHGLLYFWWRSRIPFATAMLQTVSARMGDFPAMSYVAYGALGLQAIWLVFWASTTSLSQSIIQTSSEAIIGILLFYLLLSFYWVSQVIKNVVHVTSSGTFASWYFYGSSGMPLNPTLKSLNRAVTTSFGSICLGSLLVAFLKTIRTILRSFRNGRNQILVAIVDCLLSILEGLLKYFNIYAFAQVAIYGKTYCRAAKDTFTLIKSHGLEAVINDNIISGVLTLGAFVGAIVCAVIGGVTGFLLVPDLWLTCGILGFLLGFVTASVTMEVVESGVATIFVCFAMDPLALQRNDPYLYQKFQETYSDYFSFV